MSDNSNITREEFIARVCHLGWCCYQLGVQSAIRTLENPEDVEKYKAMGDIAKFNWEPNEDQLDSLLNAVRYMMKNPGSAKENHDNWMKTKTEQGWVYGPKKDFDKKTHPDLVSYEDLLEVERAKDGMNLEMQNQAVALWCLFFRGQPK